MTGTPSPPSSSTDEWSQLELFSKSRSDSSASSERVSSCSLRPGAGLPLVGWAVSDTATFPRFKPGLVGQTIVLNQLGDTFTAEIVKLSMRLDGTPSVLLRRICDEPMEPIMIGGVALPGEAIWITGWNHCRRFLDERRCPLLP